MVQGRPAAGPVRAALLQRPVEPDPVPPVGGPRPPRRLHLRRQDAHRRTHPHRLSQRRHYR